MTRKRRASLGLLLASVAWALAACADDAREGAATSTATSPGVTTPSPATTVPGGGAPPTAATLPGQTLVLGADGLGAVRFGESAESTLATLQAALGPPSSDRPPEEPCNPALTRTLVWGNLQVNLGPGFVGYGMSLQGESRDLRTEAGIGRGSTVGDLQVTYGPRLEIIPGEADARFTVALPAGTLRGVAFTPQERDEVLSIAAGTTCSG